MIPQGFKPLLAIEHSKVKTQPTNRMVSVKLDGIRCMIFGGVAYSRTLKKIPNKTIQEWAHYNAEALENMDGELIVGDLYSPTVFNASTSGVMRIEGEPDFTFYVFDRYHPTHTYEDRYNDLEDALVNDNMWPPRTELVQHDSIGSNDALLDDLEKYYLGLGAEGVMISDGDATYKCGRSGTKMPELQKVKRFTDSEFEIVGWEPKYHNANEATTNELGRTARSTAKDGLFAMDTMGALKLKMDDGTEFSCGSGFSDDIRAYLWSIRYKLAGQFAKVKYFDNGPSGYNVPRFPIFLGIRSKDDM
jgi:DNA ligase-1